MAAAFLLNDEQFSETRSRATTSWGSAAARVRHEVRMENGVTLGGDGVSLGNDSSVEGSMEEELDEARQGGRRSPSHRVQNP